jgi:hypothetical protein
MGSPRECTRILGLESFRVERVEWEGTHRTRSSVRRSRPSARTCIGPTSMPQIVSDLVPEEGIEPSRGVTPTGF